PRARFVTIAAFLVLVTATAVVLGGWSLAAHALTGVLAGLFAAELLRRAARRRLGGMTGDVFGALIEIGTAAALLALALAA
ncbi:MAG TPA: adenosylcobinamide-GDP ribazoletransferase, partial [Streptosporangiaceae bacterium]